MKKLVLAIAVTAVGISLSVNPVRANQKETAAAIGALAILGVAALSHNKNHYRDDYEPAGEQQTAAFERGYRDGLHNERYDSSHNSSHYSQGYDAGAKERDNRLAHKTKNIGGTKVPVAAKRACVSEAASSWGVGRHDVHTVNAGQEGADNFYIELASGHKHVICGTNSKGQVFNLRNGRM